MRFEIVFEFGVKLLIRRLMQYLGLYSLLGNTTVTPFRLFRCHVG